MKTQIYSSPIGMLIIGMNIEGAVVNLQLVEGLEHSEKPDASSQFLRVFQELNEYFAGLRKVFTIQTSASGTDFQKRVWKQLTTVPYGETISYSQLAQGINNPYAARAVGNALAANPIPILIPCHRVITASGKIGNYALGAESKMLLLDLEGRDK
ncbi:MAG: methylated-DNA--[protein]-cysteine S-methyltransferase [Spirochaetia bacterium]